MAKKTEERIRVHNQGNREYTIPPSKKGGKNRILQPGRAIEIEKDVAEKFIKAYPRDLIEFDSLVSGEKKNLSKENVRLESANQTLLDENGTLKEENQALKDKLAEMATEFDEATKPSKEKKD